MKRAALVLPTLAAALSFSSLSLSQELKLDGPAPLSPRDEQATFRLPEDLRIELAAAEPEVVDPVAFAFDEHGRLYVVEMRGYPNEGIGTGDVSSGRIRLLADADGDGYFEKSTIFADRLRLPTSVMPYGGGVLVANPPDIIFLRDQNGDGKADESQTLYTGFGLANIQQMICSLQWGLDNWVYGCAGSNGGTVRSAQVDRPAVELRGRGVRFHPDVPGSLEPTSGGGQFGIAADDWGQWFTATNSQHLRHIVLPDHYLRRNPFLAVSAVSINIPDHGAACKVHRISPFESWRVERTRRRKESDGAKRFAVTELVPGGYSTSTCGTLVYRADSLPASYRGQVFVCDPANNLIHRDALVDSGATFIGKRVEEDCEFLASTDNWFRPVNLQVGPDGCIYVADFYREAIETPLSLPEDIKKALNLNSRGRGRIWRIRPRTGDLPAQSVLGNASPAALVAALADSNAWRRLTAQRLLVERQDKNVAAAVRKLAEQASPQGRLHALWTLAGLGNLTTDDVERALRDPVAGVRENALQMSEPLVAASPKLRKTALALADDPAPRVRFQLAFTLGEMPGQESAVAFHKLALHPATESDAWMHTALLSSARATAARHLASLAAENTKEVRLARGLAQVVGAAGESGDLATTIKLIARAKSDAWRFAVLEGLGQGLQSGGKSLSKLWETPAFAAARPFFKKAEAAALDDQASELATLQAIRLLGYGPFDNARSLSGLLNPRQSPQVQLAAVRALATHDHTDVADLLLVNWQGYGPTMRAEVLESLFGRQERLPRLLDAVAAKKVLGAQLGPARLQQLRAHANAGIRQRATTLLAREVAPSRQKVVEDYAESLKLDADAVRGKMLFGKTCAVCHRLEEVGVEVGADLRAVLTNKTAAALLIDILDPSREVDSRYIEYIVATESGRVATGIIAAETGTSVTLRRAEKVEDTILRNQIDTIQATARSLMPDGLEMQLSRQDVADVIAYLLAAAKR